MKKSKAQEKGSSLFIIFISLSLLLTSFGSAVLDEQTQTNVNTGNGLEVEYPKFDAIKNGEAFNLTLFTYNITDGRILLGSNCSLQIFSHQGERVYNALNLSGIEKGYNHYLSAGNFTVNDVYSFSIYCENQEIGGFASGLFEVTPSGKLNVHTFLWLFLAIISLTLILGIGLRDNWLMFFGFLEILFFGFFVIIYGIDIFKDVMTTRAIGFILWGISLIGMYKSAEGMLQESFGR